MQNESQWRKTWNLFILKEMEVMHNSETTGVNEMWENFRDTLQHRINSHIPHHQSRSKYGYPWIGFELKKMMKRQHRFYKLKKENWWPSTCKTLLGPQPIGTYATKTSILGIYGKYCHPTRPGEWVCQYEEILDIHQTLKERQCYCLLPEEWRQSV